VKIRILPDNKEIEIETIDNMTVQEMLSKLDLDLDDILIIVNEKVIDDPNYIITKEVEVKTSQSG